MIAFLKGEVISKQEKTIILNTGNIGYLIYIPSPLLEKIAIGQEIELFIHTRVSQDDITLFGLETYSDLEFFKTLISVNGVGAKTALEIISASAEKVKSAIVSNDLRALTSIPGIGKKTAERIVLELKGNASVLATAGRKQSTLKVNNINEDALDALLGLGYQKHVILRKLESMPDTITKIEEIITYVLKNN